MAPVQQIRSAAHAAALVLAAALSGFAQTPSGWPCGRDEAKLVASDGAAGDLVGQSNALDGDTLLVGAGGADEAAADAGAAYVFVRTGTTWAFQAKLLANDAGPDDQLGSSAALHGDTAAVGARFADAVGLDSGAAYVFVRSGTTWTQQQKLVASDASSSAALGNSIALADDLLVVGAPSEDALGTNAGAAYVFARSGTQWTEIAKLTAADAAPGHQLGTGVALERTGAQRIALGAPFAGTGGAVYVFVRSGNSWVQEKRLTALDAAPGDRFGRAVALHATRVVAGAPLADAVGSDSGAAYVFALGPGGWAQEQKLIGAHLGSEDIFGWSVALHDDACAVGSPWHDDQGARSGAAWVFARSGTSWTEALERTAADGGPGDSFGVSVSIDRERVTIGAYQNSIAGLGAVYVVSSPGWPEPYCTAKTNSCGGLPSIASSGVPSAAATAGFQVMASGTTAGKAGLLLYGDTAPASTPFHGGLLCIALPVRRSVAVVDTLGTPGACDGELALDVSAFAAGLLGGHPSPALRVPGTRFYAQFWGRDTLAHGALLSDALTWGVCP